MTESGGSNPAGFGTLTGPIVFPFINKLGGEKDDEIYLIVFIRRPSNSNFIFNDMVADIQKRYSTRFFHEYSFTLLAKSLWHDGYSWHVNGGYIEDAGDIDTYKCCSLRGNRFFGMVGT